MVDTQRVYVVPLIEQQLNNNLFNKSNRGMHAVWYFVREYCRREGVALETVDKWNGIKKPGDILLVFDHPHLSLVRRVAYFLKRTLLKKSPFKVKYHNFKNLLHSFPKRILFQVEPSVVTPYPYKNLKKLGKAYNSIYLTSKVEGYNYFHMPQMDEGPIEPYFSNKDRNFLVMANSNKKPLSRNNELYGERLKALRYFSRSNQIDLYGAYWDRPLFFPYTFYKKDIDKVYKGFAENKLEMMSRYEFAICFENEIAPGWVTEKIFDCFLAGTIPIYYGAPNITDYIPSECFIDFREFKGYSDLENYLKALTVKDLERYRESAKSYYRSDKFREFSKERIAKIVVDAVRSVE